MATARVIPPITEDVPAKLISISATHVPSPGACIIANGQSVTFANSSVNAVGVFFEPDAFGVAVFNNITVPGNSSTTVSPLVNNRTVNYNTDGSTTYPYAIQVGNGPLYVKVTGGYTTPDPAVVPFGGTIEIISTDNNYTINWNTTNGNPFPGLTHIYTASNPLTRAYSENLPVADYAYTITQGITLGSGGGTVKIKSTN
jgi:hypothetical protein